MKTNINITPEEAKAQYWGSTPLPEGAKCLGGYKDAITGRTGALIKFANGICSLGNSGHLYIIGKERTLFSNTHWSVHSSQIRDLVKERNEYRRLLKKSLNAFNVLRNHRISESLNDTTYALASEIDSAFKRFDQEETSLFVENKK